VTKLIRHRRADREKEPDFAPVPLIGAEVLPWKIRGKGGACAIASDGPQACPCV
jgi:hypothetical protein